MDAVAPCTRLESLCLDWLTLHAGYQDDELHAQDVHACEILAIVLASTPQTLRRLTFAVPEMKSPSHLADTLSCLAPRVEEAVEKFPGLETISIRVSCMFPAEDCMNAARSTLPTRLLDSGVLRIDHKYSLWFCRL